jgi:Acyl-CoA reductase (LuxC)
VEVLIPHSSNGWQAHLEQMENLPPLQPFAAESINFIDSFSKAVLTEAHMRSFPEIIALGHWMRRAHILEMKDQFNAERGDRVFLPRGVALHFAPSNVDSIFLYSWFLSLLIGNLNIVRLSMRRNDQLTQLIATVNCVLARPEFDAVRERSLVLRFEHDDAITEALSAKCQIRVLWGGDQAISRLRQIPLPPLATEVVFADRFSFSVVKAAAVLQQDEMGFGRLIRNFFADSFWFDQMACSSPRMVVWIGAALDIAEAKQRFWPALQAYVAEHGVQYPAAVGVTRLTTMYAYIAEGEVDAILSSPAEIPARAHLNRDARRFRDMHCGGGMFLELECEQLQDFLPLIQPKDQTMSVFGFERPELQKFAREIPNRAIDRIVELGKSLNFSWVWDGVDLLRAFSRQVEIDV